MKRWLANLEARLIAVHARNVTRNNPWPRAGAITTRRKAPQ